MRISKHKQDNIEVDEIFLDSANLPGYDRENLEGTLENPIRKSFFLWLGWIFLIFGIIFAGKVSFLQIVRGAEFRERASKNYLKVITEYSARGLIYDRDGKALVKNIVLDGKLRRVYPSAGFLHVLGFKNESGLEASYDEILRGVQTKKAEEIDANGNSISSGILEKGKPGKNIQTTLSSDLQTKFAEIIFSTIKERGFLGGAGIILNPADGEILALVSEPEFDPNILIFNPTEESVNKLLKDPGKPFFNRAVSGLYPPGSIVKPALAIAALVENIISPNKKILSTGSISLPNPYNPIKPNVFLDWKAHGWVDMKEALAVSSDVYFYEIGGGYQDQKGLGPWNIKKYLAMFGFSSLSGIDLGGEARGHIPDPDEKQDGRDWTIGDTYNISIGQGDILVTPLQAAVYAMALANKGDMSYPHIVKAILDQDKSIVEKFDYPPKQKINISSEVFDVARAGMRQAVLTGTAYGLAGLPVELAAKTGTAEIGDTDKVHSWSIGFFPYENPKFAFAILMESGPRNNTIGATYVASQIIRWMADNGFTR